MGAVRVVAAVAARPSLWATAVRMWWRTTPGDWYRTRPYLPVPDRHYLHFRLVTQYGRDDAPVEPVDVLNYLAWCKQQDRAA
ncbi:MAG: hypothetical protein ACOYMR_09435 [Ilumatobacteraceae bacterium]